MEGHRNVLVVENGSPAALDEALRLADQGNCWVTVLKVLPPYDGDVDLTGVKKVRDVITSGRRGEASRLAAAVRDDNAARVRVEQGAVPETVGRVAAEEKSDIIVMGARKDAGMIQRHLDGRLFRKITKSAPCPVMVVDVK